MEEYDESPFLYISLSEVVPYMSKTMSINRTRQTIYNWATKGVERGLGRVVRLRTIKQAGSLRTTRGWVKEFVDEVSV